jgi:hypothetical protein
MSGKMGQKGFSAVGSLFSDRLLGIDVRYLIFQIKARSVPN